VRLRKFVSFVFAPTYTYCTNFFNLSRELVRPSSNSRLLVIYGPMNRIVTQNTFSGHQTQSASCMAWPTINGMSALQTRIQRNSTTHADKFVKLTIYRLPNSFWTDRKFHPIRQWKNGYKKLFVDYFLWPRQEVPPSESSVRATNW